MIRALINRLLFPNTCDNEHFVAYLRSNGAKIGKDTRFIYPKKCSVDPGRLDYISIGENCCLSYVTLIAHDYSWYVFRDAFNDIVPDAGGEIVIGNNCFVGYEACILKGTTIGDNVIIGARSLVKGDIPSNTVWAGVPARQICALDEYYQKRRENNIQQAMYCRDHIRKCYDKNPSISDMGFFSFLFLERTKDNYSKYIKNMEFNGIKDDTRTKSLFFETKPIYESFEDFLES